MSWWLWALGALCLARVLRAFDIAPVKAAWSAALTLFGGCVVFRGVELIILSLAGSPYKFPWQVGLAGVLVGAMALAEATKTVWDVVHAQRRSTTDRLSPSELARATGA